MRTNLTLLLVLASVVGLTTGCDEKKPTSTTGTSTSASAVVSAMPPTTASAPASVATAADSAVPTSGSATAPAGSSGTSMITGDAKDVVLTVKDPAKEPEKTIKAQVGGSVTLFLPDFPGTVWAVDTTDKTLGKPKEEVIPGFAPGTNGHQFKWTTANPLLKAGGKHKATFGNKKAGDKAAKPTSTFTLNIEMT